MRSAIALFFLFLTFLSVVLSESDYYKILGVDRNADEKEIKRAYRELSKKFHPDKNPGDEEAQNKYMDITNAYDVLMDSEKRSVYDRYGEDGIKGGAGNGGGQGRGGGGGGFRHGGGDPFSSFFGFNQGPPRAQDVSSEIQVDLADFFNGKDIDFNISLRDNCDKCKGTGSSDGLKHPCDSCGGRGRVIQRFNMGNGMIQKIETTCPKCQGSGQVIKNKCKTCRGEGAYDQIKNFNLHVNPGTPRNHIEKFHGKGPTQPGIIAGDLNIILKESPNSNLGYRRSGNNLYRTEVLSLKEALFGDWERKIKFFDEYNPTITIKRNKFQSVSDGEIEVIKGKGMPILNGNDEYGNLYIEYVVIFPVANKKLLQSLHDEL